MTERSNWIQDKFNFLKMNIGRKGLSKLSGFKVLAEEPVHSSEDRDFQTFINKAVKLLTSIQSKAEDRGHQPQQSQQHTLSRSSSAASTFVTHTFEQPQESTPAAREYIITIPETQMPARQAIQTAQQTQVATKGQQQPRGQPTSFLVVDNQQAGPSRLLTFTLTLTKQFNPLSDASATGKKVFGNLLSVLSYQQIDKLQPFSPPYLQTQATSLPNTTAQQQHHQQPAQP